MQETVSNASLYKRMNINLKKTYFNGNIVNLIKMQFFQYDDQLHFMK